MIYPSLNNAGVTIDSTLDSVTIIDNFQSVRGGRTLDTTGFTPTTIKAGHLIIRATSDPKDYKPMPLNGGATAYAALPSGHEYAGVLISTILTARPFAGIMLRGTVNRVSSPFDPSGLEAAFKAALPNIIFTQD
ncbi:hypothetical protein GO755_34930 [Spirosoma sp. HMF4905]|uniref:Head decoration protein n=1 Tax=Spirosoma arboris TaxID=2682092 RepID=A0A7K1SN97_9BACT|nr:hypothetical protein [Spirosoma arboris]MVM35269.1 hypothetical protein [Spirosoma arboris]